MLERDQLRGDQMYRLFQKADESDEMWFYTPDGIGGYWYDTRAELLEAHGPGRIISAQIPSWF